MLVSDNSPSNENGWGPQFSSVTKPTTTVDRVPYAPYQKGRYNKMKVADWTNTARKTYVTRGSVTNTSMNFFENGDDFSLVDRTQQKKRDQKAKPREKKVWGNKATPKATKNVRAKGRKQQQKKRTKNRYNPSAGNYGYYKQNRKYSPSVDIQASWGEPVLDIDFKNLRTAVYTDDVEVENISVVGRVERFNDFYESVSARKGKHLDKRWGSERTFNRTSTTSDPILEDLKTQQSGNVYATDAIIATLMTTLKSIYSWDILIRKENGNIYLDKRDDSPIDYLTVNENSSDPPQEKANPVFNSLKALHHEATSINQNFSQQVLLKEPGTDLTFGEGNPFAENAESAGYKYRKWSLGDIQLVARSQFNAYKLVNGNPEFLLVKSLNEYDTKITNGWRKLLETLRNGVFSTQLQHNVNKMTKWAIEAHLSEAYGIELGYVSRNNPKDFTNHVILGVDFYKADSFMSELSGFSIDKMWGTFVHIIDTIKTLEDGNYVLLRDPNANILQFYHLNDDDFERVFHE